MKRTGCLGKKTKNHCRHGGPKPSRNQIYIHNIDQCSIAQLLIVVAAKNLSKENAAHRLRSCEGVHLPRQDFTKNERRDKETLPTGKSIREPIQNGESIGESNRKLKGNTIY